MNKISLKEINRKEGDLTFTQIERDPSAPVKLELHVWPPKQPISTGGGQVVSIKRTIERGRKRRREINNEKSMTKKGSCQHKES